MRFTETAVTILEVVGAVTKTSAYGGAGNDSMTIGGVAQTPITKVVLALTHSELVVLFQAPLFLETIPQQLMVVLTRLLLATQHQPPTSTEISAMTPSL